MHNLLDRRYSRARSEGERKRPRKGPNNNGSGSSPRIRIPASHLRIYRLDGSGTADALRVRGNLTIRGKTQPVIMPLTLTHLDDGTYRARGEYKLKQTAFGIQPIQLAGGTVKVKDEVRTEFELFLK